ncbi:Na+/alanine symporter [Acinetobacter baylyi]|nr:Na+/alanine symporter [Acinetobacter baylyi]
MVLFFFMYCFFIFIFFFNKNGLQSKEYWSILDKAFSSEENIELYDLFFLISKHKYKSSNLSIFIAIIISQITFVIVMNGFLKIPSAYEFYIMSGVFLFISFFIIVNMKLSVIYPYYFLKQKECIT